MAIPALQDGLLPEGVHPCTIAELRERFGVFQETDCRCRLFEKLQAYLQEIGSTGPVAWLVVNGSFVTATPAPNDIDLILVLDPDHDFEVALRPPEYNAISRRQLRRRFGFDVLVAREASPELAEYLAFFQQVRGQPGLRKGILRVVP